MIKKIFLSVLAFIFISIPCLATLKTGRLDEIPALHEGRVKPLYAIADESYSAISGTKKLPSLYKSPMQWLIDLSCNHQLALEAPIFPNSSLEIQKTLNIKRPFVSWNEISPYLPKLYEEYQEAQKQINPTLYQSELQEFFERVFLFQSLRNTLTVYDHEVWEREIDIYTKSLELDKLEQLPSKIDKENKELLEWYTKRYHYLSEAALWYPLAPEKKSQEWDSVGSALLCLSENNEMPPLLSSYISLISALENEDQTLLTSSTEEIYSLIKTSYPKEIRKAQIESYLLKMAPFSICMYLHFTIFCLGVLCWFWQSKTFWKVILILSILSIALQTLSIGTRVYLEGRPPVTSLYSSALFISWVAAICGLIIEVKKPSGMGFTVLGFLGGATLLVASKLELGASTMESLRAVLNSNFWLATHVIMITIGYSVTLFAGFLSNLFIIRSLINKSFLSEQKKTWIKVIYHSVFISLFFSFTGTMLGGIWADQSWGRFWGWDPKENGALVIVLWNALILHAKWGGMIKDRGMAILTSLGVITTLLSWFGVNMLGAGLHSYGFMDRAFTPLVIVIVCQLFISMLGSFTNSKAYKA